MGEGSIMQIRVAGEDDLPALVEFEIEIARISFPEDPITSPATHTKKLTKALQQSPEGMFVADVDGQVVGWLWVTVNTQFLTGERYANFRSFALHPDWRGGETGQQLMEFCVDYCRKQDVKWITGKVHVKNLAMRALYAALAFQPKHLTMEYRFDEEEKP